MQDTPREYLIGQTTLEIQETVSRATGLPAYRGKQISQWLYQKGQPGQGGGIDADFRTMTDLPSAAREQLTEKFDISPLTLQDRQEDSRDGTVKTLSRLNNGGHLIECVLLPDTKRVSSCLSSQAGCPMGCTFCATGTQGLSRNLTAGEIVAQWLLLQAQSTRRISHIVLMGMGEPLLNYDNTVKAIRILNSECGVAMRHITLSTVGIVPNIYKLAEENLQITLAVSLHAPNDELREEIVPVAKTYTMDKLMAACRHYAEETHRRLTFEYVLLKEVNDRPEDARKLSQLLKSMPAALNIIPYNPTTVTQQFARPEPERIRTFRDILENNGIIVTQRKERGQEIAAACGQLVTESTRQTLTKHILPVLQGAATHG